MIPAHLPSEAAPNYRARLSPWCIVQLMPNLKRVEMMRFRGRSHAEECLKVLRRLQPTCVYQIVFDPVFMTPIDQ